MFCAHFTPMNTFSLNLKNNFTCLILIRDSNCIDFEQRWRKMTSAQEDAKSSGHEEFTHTGSVGEAPV